MESAQTTSPFPNPPEFAKQYTEENIKNGNYLPPPPLPMHYTAFNEEYNLEGPLLHSLSDAGIQQLFSSNASWKSELKKLNRSVVAAFLDLIHILIHCPDKVDRTEKLETIRLLFINMHHLINEYRPVQARDTLRQMMIRQNKEIKDVVDKLEKINAAGKKTIDFYCSYLKNRPIDDENVEETASSKVNSEASAIVPDNAK